MVHRVLRRPPGPSAGARHRRTATAHGPNQPLLCIGARQRRTGCHRWDDRSHVVTCPLDLLEAATFPTLTVRHNASRGGRRWGVCFQSWRWRCSCSKAGGARGRANRGRSSLGHRDPAAEPRAVIAHGPLGLVSILEPGVVSVGCRLPCPGEAREHPSHVGAAGEALVPPCWLLPLPC